MRRSAAATREKILESAYALFYARGYARVGVDEIAAAAGITKRTLYSHFESKDALIANVMERQHAQAQPLIDRWANSLAGATPAAIDNLFAELAGWAAKPRWAGAGFTRIAMELADLRGHPARLIARKHKTAIEDRLARVLGSRRAAVELTLLLEGTMAMLIISGDRRYAEAAASAAKRLLADRHEADSPATPESAADSRRRAR
jgi:AcrR family transcriptional regulator